MKYVLMCGGIYKKFNKPKQLLKVNGEVLVERTIRLLKENGITDISICTNGDDFDYLGLPILKQNNKYGTKEGMENISSEYSWLNAFYDLKEPACYLYGDVWFTNNAIKTIINTKVDKTMFFCICDIQDGRKSINPKGREPIAYKVQDQKVFRKAINDLLKMVNNGLFKDKIAPFSWHLYRYLNGMDYLLDDWGEMNNIFSTKGDYVIIDDITTDVDNIKDIDLIEKYLRIGGGKMVKCEVINQNVTIREFNRLKNIKRLKSNEEVEQHNFFEIGDTFETDEDMARYLAGETPEQQIVCIKILEVIPEEKEKKTEAPKEEQKYPKKIEKKPIAKKSKKVK